MPAKTQLPAWLTSKPFWFWPSIVGGIWILVVLAKLVVFPSQLDKPREAEKQRQSQQLGAAGKTSESGTESGGSSAPAGEAKTSPAK
jgi:hypothetical protein